jgi:hypothetical protein
MKDYMRLFPLVFIFSLLIVLFAPGCESTGDNASDSTPFILEPSSPIKVNLSISKLPVLDEPVKITCNVSSIDDMPNSNAQVQLSQGATLISGNLEWQGDLEANVPISFSAQIVFNETGHQTIEATARHVIDDNNSWGDLDIIYLDIGSEDSTFGWPASPVPIVRTDKYSVIKTDLEISHAPKLNEPAKLFITTISPVDFPGLSVGILIYPKSAVLSDSNSQLVAIPLVPSANQIAMQVTGVDLQANVPYHFSAIVVFNDTGYYHVTADTRQKIDNTTYHGTQDTIYLKIGVNQSKFEQEPEKEIPLWDLPPPPTINP